MLRVLPFELLAPTVGASGYFVIGQFQAPLVLVFLQYHHPCRLRNNSRRIPCKCTYCDAHAVAVLCCGSAGKSFVKSGENFVRDPHTHTAAGGGERVAFSSPAVCVRAVHKQINLCYPVHRNNAPRQQALARQHASLAHGHTPQAWPPEHQPPIRHATPAAGRVLSHYRIA